VGKDGIVVGSCGSVTRKKTNTMEDNEKRQGGEDERTCLMVDAQGLMNSTFDMHCGSSLPLPTVSKPCHTGTGVPFLRVVFALHPASLKRR
jgi:hypothetical protein